MKKIARPVLIVALTATTVAFVNRVVSRQTPGKTQSSFMRANAILDEALAAMGGIQALSTITATTFSYDADVFLRNQSPAPDSPWARQQGHGTFTWEEGGRMRSRVERNFRGGATFDNTILMYGDSGFIHNEITGQWTRMAPTEISIATGGPTGNPSRAMPSSLLRAALSNRASLRLADDADTNSAAGGILFTLRDGTLVTMTVDPASHLPASWEWMGGDPILGDAVNTVTYSDYREVSGVKFPHRIDFEIADSTLSSWSIRDVAINPQLDSSFFAPPADSLVTGYAPAFSPVQVGEHLYALRLFSGLSNSYNTLLAELDDYVVVVEAPLVDVLAGFVTQVSQSLFGDKPIRYVVSTHYHADHIGGIRGYMARGATLITGAQTATQARRMVATHSILQPNPMEGQSPSIREVDYTFSLNDGMEMRVIEVGPTPHVDDLVLIYFPESKVLYTGDHFSTRENGYYGAANESLLWLANKLDELDLEVETFVPTHGAPTGIDEFRRMVAAD